MAGGATKARAREAKIVVETEVMVVTAETGTIEIVTEAEVAIAGAEITMW